MALWGRREQSEPKVARLSRSERKELRTRAREDAELAARIQRAQRRLAQATGPLPVIEPRVSVEQPARRSEIVDG
jgi:anti-sigma-K factor RskA